MRHVQHQVFFKPARIGGIEFVDGAVFANNPAEYFLNMLRMHIHDSENAWLQPLIVSVGTGIFYEPVQGRSFWRKLVHGLMQNITDTEHAHRRVAELCRLSGLVYHRLNIEFPYGCNIGIDAYQESDLDCLSDPFGCGKAAPHHFCTEPDRHPPSNYAGEATFDFDRIINHCLGIPLQSPL